MFDAQHFNSGFFEKAASASGREKLSEYGGTYIRDRLREESFFDKILPPQDVTRRDLQRSVNHDTLVRIRDIEPQSRAMSLTFRGQPRARYIKGDRYEIGFHTLSTEKFEKIEQELMAYEMPITKIIEDNSIKDLHEVWDREGLIHIESCIQAMQEGFLNAQGNLLSGSLQGFNSSNIRNGLVDSVRVVKGEGALMRSTDDFVPLPVQRGDFISLQNMLDGNYLKAERVLIMETDWNDVGRLTLDDFGDKVSSEVVVDGYKYNQFMGLKVIRTIKSRLLRKGNIYAFCAPEFMGDSYILNQTKFYIDKVANLFSWQAWMDRGAGFGNIATMAKLELYSGSVTQGATDTGYAKARPVSEENLEFKNNRVEDGLYFPKVASF